MEAAFIINVLCVTCVRVLCVTCVRMAWGALLTPERGQHTDVGAVEQRQSVVVDVQVRQVRDEVVAHQETHQDPVVDDPLQVIFKGDLFLRGDTRRA